MGEMSELATIVLFVILLLSVAVFMWWVDRTART